MLTPEDNDRLRYLTDKPIRQLTPKELEELKIIADKSDDGDLKESVKKEQLLRFNELGKEDIQKQAKAFREAREANTTEEAKELDKAENNAELVRGKGSNDLWFERINSYNNIDNDGPDSSITGKSKQLKMSKDGKILYEDFSRVKIIPLSLIPNGKKQNYKPYLIPKYKKNPDGSYVTNSNGQRIPLYIDKRNIATAEIEEINDPSNKRLFDKYATEKKFSDENTNDNNSVKKNELFDRIWFEPIFDYQGFIDVTDIWPPEEPDITTLDKTSKTFETFKKELQKMTDKINTPQGKDLILNGIPGFDIVKLPEVPGEKPSNDTGRRKYEALFIELDSEITTESKDLYDQPNKPLFKYEENILTTDEEYATSISQRKDAMDYNLRDSRIWDIKYTKGDRFRDDIFTSKLDKSKIRRFSRTFDDFLDSAQSVLQKTDMFQQQTVLFNEQVIDDLRDLGLNLLLLEELVQSIDSDNAYKAYFFDLLEKVRGSFVNFMDYVKQLKQDEYSQLNMDQQKTISDLIAGLRNELKNSIVTISDRYKNEKTDLINRDFDNKTGKFAVYEMDPKYNSQNTSSGELARMRREGLFRSNKNIYTDKDKAILMEAKKNVLANNYLRNKDMSVFDISKGSNPKNSTIDIIDPETGEVKKMLMKDLAVKISENNKKGKYDEYYLKKIKDDLEENNNYKFENDPQAEKAKENLIKDLKDNITTLKENKKITREKQNKLESDFEEFDSIISAIRDIRNFNENENNTRNNRSATIESTDSNESEINPEFFEKDAKPVVNSKDINEFIGLDDILGDPENINAQRVETFISKNINRTLPNPQLKQIIRYLKTETEFNALKKLIETEKEGNIILKDTPLGYQFYHFIDFTTRNNTKLSSISEWFLTPTNQLIGGGRRTRKRMIRKKRNATKKKRYSVKNGRRVKHRISKPKKRFIFHPVFSNQQQAGGFQYKHNNASSSITRKRHSSKLFSSRRNKTRR